MTCPKSRSELERAQTSKSAIDLNVVLALPVEFLDTAAPQEQTKVKFWDRLPGFNSSIQLPLEDKEGAMDLSCVQERPSTSRSFTRKTSQCASCAWAAGGTS